MSNQPNKFLELASTDDVQKQAFLLLYETMNNPKYGIKTRMDACRELLDRTVPKTKAHDVSSTRPITIMYVSPQVGAKAVLDQQKSLTMQTIIELPQSLVPQEEDEDQE